MADADADADYADDADAAIEEVVMPDSKREIALVAPDQQRNMAYLRFRMMLDMAYEQVERDVEEGKLKMHLPPHPPGRP